MSLKNSSQVSISHIVWRILTSPRLFKAAIRYIFYVLRDFFWKQFETKIFPSKRPVVNVNHPLDDTIPYKQDVVHIYLSFIKLWIKALSYLDLVLGKKGEEDLLEFLDGLSYLYIQAGRIYDQTQSTTSRPSAQGHPRFVMIHITDPHLHCVPSLHVMIVCYTYMQSSLILKRHFGDLTEKYQKELDYLYGQAVSITETILLVKQHSVNCISAALLFMTDHYKEFNNEECIRFINDLFVDGLEELENRDEIIYHITSLYKDMVNKMNKESLGSKEVILDFLEGYAKGKIPFYDSSIQKKETIKV